MEVETEFDPALSTLAMPPAAQSRHVKRQNTRRMAVSAMTGLDPHFPRAGHPCHEPDANLTEL